MYLRRAGCYDRKESTNNLQLYLLIYFGSAFANLINDGIDKLSWQCSIAPRFFFLWINTVIRMVSVEKAVCDQLLNMVEDLFCEPWNFSVKSQLHNLEVFVGTENFIRGVSFDLLDSLVTAIS